ncbi:MAG: glutamate mutase L, partial [Candidatus Brocadiia bacterium]
IAREALRLAFEQHKQLAVGLKGVQRERTVSEAFDETPTGETIIDMEALDLLVGSGGVLSHAPRRAQAAMMLIDAFQPLGVTRLAVDSIFMMPHLGVLAQVHEEAAEQVFLRDCLIHLGTCIAPAGHAKRGSKCFRYTLEAGDDSHSGSLAFGELVRLPLPAGQTARLVAEPTRRFDLGEGKGKTLDTEVHGGVVGLVLDARGRPLAVPQEQRSQALEAWANALDAYPQ